MTDSLPHVTPNFTLTHGAPRAQQPRPIDPKAAELLKMRKAASDFESLFLSQLIKTMQSTVHKTEQGKSLGGEIMLDIASEKLAENLAKKGGVGLGDMIYNSMKQRMPADSSDTKIADRPIPRESDQHFQPLAGTAAVAKKH